MLNFRNILIALAASYVTQAQVLPLPRADGSLKLDFKVKTELTKVVRSEDEILVPLKNTRRQYTADISLGSNEQNITVVVDTGSADLWVVGKGFHCDALLNQCSDAASYDPSTSTTSVDLHKAFNVGYANQNTVSGKYYKDSITIGGQKIDGMQFGVASTSSISGSGVLGLGLESIESYPGNYTNFIGLLQERNLLKENIFSLFLDSPNATSGSVLFGGIDETKFSGDLVELPLQDDTFYSVTLDSIKIANDAIGVNDLVLLDSGSAYTMLPRPVLDQIANYTSNPEFSPFTDQYVIDCVVPDGELTFEFGRASIAVPWESVITKVNSDVCLLNFMVSSDGNILGDDFLRNAYVVYDFGAKKIRLAQAKYD